MAARELMACPDYNRTEKSGPVKRRRRPSCGDGQVGGQGMDGFGPGDGLMEDELADADRGWVAVCVPDDGMEQGDSKGGSESVGGCGIRRGRMKDSRTGNLFGMGDGPMVRKLTNETVRRWVWWVRWVRCVVVRKIRSMDSVGFGVINSRVGHV